MGRQDAEDLEAKRRVRELMRRGESPESVETLTVQLSRLQLHSLEPLGVCTRLKRLDLSRNTIRSLAGAEFLAQLESLNLYGNKLADLGELLRLRQLPSLADVDLRMNPVVNQDSYRLFAIKYLPRTMRRLDGSEISALQRCRAESLFANLDCSSSSSGDDSDHVLDEHKEAPDQQENIHPGQLAPALPPDPTRVDRKDKHLLPSHVGGLAEQPRDPVCGILCTQGMPGALGASNVTGHGHVDALEMVAPDSEILFEHRIQCEIDKLPETEELALLKRQLVPALRRSDCPESEVTTEAVGIAQGELEKPAENKEDCECIKGASGSEGQGGNLQAQLQPTPFMFQTSSETAAVGREVRAEVERLVQEQRKRVTELEARLTASQQEARAYLTRAVDAESRAAAAEAQVARVTERAGDGEAERSLVEMLKESHRVLMSDSHRLREDLEAERAARRRDQASFEANWRQFQALQRRVLQGDGCDGVGAGGGTSETDFSGYAVGSLALTERSDRVARNNSSERVVNHLAQSRASAVNAQAAEGECDAVGVCRPSVRQERAATVGIWAMPSAEEHSEYMRALEFDDDVFLATPQQDPSWPSTGIHCYTMHQVDGDSPQLVQGAVGDDVQARNCTDEGSKVSKQSELPPIGEDSEGATSEALGQQSGPGRFVMGLGLPTEMQTGQHMQFMRELEVEEDAAL